MATSLTNPNPKREDERVEAALTAWMEASELGLPHWSTGCKPATNDHMRKCMAAALSAASARLSPGDPVRPTISDAQLHAAMDAFYPGENWRVDLGCALESSLRDMKSAIRAALSVSTPTGEREGRLYEAARVLINRWSDAPELPEEMEQALASFEEVWLAIYAGKSASLAHPQQGGEREAVALAEDVLPDGWRWIAVYQLAHHWEYCIERRDFTRCEGRTRTKEEARSEAVKAAHRYEARLSSPAAPTSPSKSSGEEA